MKELPTNLQEAYRAANGLDQKRNSSHYIIVKTLNTEKKENKGVTLLNNYFCISDVFIELQRMYKRCIVQVQLFLILAWSKYAISFQSFAKLNQ